MTYSNLISTSDRRDQPATRRWLVWLVGGSALVTAITVLLWLLGNGTVDSSVVPCADRDLELDISSSSRSDRMRQVMIDLAAASASSAAVCSRTISVHAVAGGGQVRPVLTTDDLQPFIPRGPNPEVRRSHFKGDGAIRAMVTKRIDEILAEQAAVGSTTLSALYQAAAEHSGPETDIVLITDGVNQDDTINLNRPLNPGEGRVMAERVTVPRVAGRQVTLVGLGQVDSVTPPPGATWMAEVKEFNLALCSTAGSGDCRLFTSASPSEALDTPTGKDSQ